MQRPHQSKHWSMKQSLDTSGQAVSNASPTHKSLCDLVLIAAFCSVKHAMGKWALKMDGLYLTLQSDKLLLSLYGEELYDMLKLLRVR